MPPPARANGPVASAVVGLVALVASAVCGWLGLWQWERAHARAEVIEALPAVPLGELAAPSTGSTTAIGRAVTVSGSFGGGAAVVPGRAVDGVDAEFLVREFVVASGATGTGDPATLVVIVGWRPTGAAEAIAPPPSARGLSGFLRAGESAPVGTGDIETAADGATIVTRAVSPAQLAQAWGTPMYAVVLVQDVPEPGWTALEPPPQQGRLSIQSLAYALEWWLFGLFALVVAGRWIRDNGRVRVSNEGGSRDGDDDS